MREDHIRVAAALRRLARRQDLKDAVLASPALYRVLLAAASRYVAGETHEEALSVSARLATATEGTWAGGHRCIIDFMGEDTRDVLTARAATDEFLALIGALGSAADGGLQARTSISLDLSHIGLAVTEGADGRSLAAAHLTEIAAAASAMGREVVISMEDSSRTDAILGIHAAVSAQYPQVGITLQAGLHRTADDLSVLLTRSRADGAHRQGRIRLVKGAYAESPERAVGRGAELDARYRRLAMQLIDSAAAGQHISVATHDPALLEALMTHAGTHGGPSAFPQGALQFEMLHGVCPDRLADVARAGFATQVYLVYGREWYLYLCHRLAEHPPSLLDALADCVEALPLLAGEPAGLAPRMIGSSARANRG